MKGLIAFGLFSGMLVYFCAGFTTLALLTFLNEGAVDMSKSIIVGAALAFFQILRFGWDFFQDRRDGVVWQEGPIDG